MELIRQKMAENGTVVLAEYQSEGKGQFGREWMSNAYENLMFSIILKHVTNAPPNPFIINKTITVSMHQCLSKLLPDSQIKIKWPNDIYVDMRKISGILVENNFSGHHLNYSIIGIGLNVNQDFESIKDLKATSLKSKTGELSDRPGLLKQILEQFETNYLQMNTNSDTIEKLFNENLLGYRETSEFDIHDTIEKARIVECDKSGRLILEINAEHKPFLHGEIKQLIHA